MPFKDVILLPVKGDGFIVGGSLKTFRATNSRSTPFTRRPREAGSSWSCAAHLHVH